MEAPFYIAYQQRFTVFDKLFEGFVLFFKQAQEGHL
jgi:hypothetical protein